MTARYFKAESDGVVMVRDAGEHFYAVAVFCMPRVTFHRSRESAEDARFEDADKPGFSIVPVVEITAAEYRNHCRFGRNAGVPLVNGERQGRIAKTRRRAPREAEAAVA